MPYLSELDKEFYILDLFVNENVPRTILEIARALGYKTAKPVRKTLNAMYENGHLLRWEQQKPNGQIRFLFYGAEHIGRELQLVARERNLEHFFGSNF